MGSPSCVLAVALMLVLALVGCADPARPQAGVDAEGDDALEADITAPPIDPPLRNPEEHVGQQVTVASDVEAVFGPHAFTLAAPQGPFLVVSAIPVDGRVVERGAPLQVTGTLREGFSATEVEDDLGVDLDDALADLVDLTYLVADSVSELAQDEGA